MKYSMKKGFTLIELLVVIAIIAILAAILFPVFAQAKLAAKKTVDLSNVKQIALATMMYCTDSDDMFPRNDYRLPTRYSWGPITYRELTGPYVKNGIDNVSWVMIDPTQTGPVADAGLWESPGQPAGSRYGYAANEGLFPSSQLWTLDEAGATGNNFVDQTSAGYPTGESPTPSVSQTQLSHAATTAMLTTVGITIPWSSAWTYMQGSVWYWQGGSETLRGATIPPQWDSDNALPPDSSGNLSGVGPYSSLPRFRYTNQANVAWADGHAKSRQKGAFSWCSDIYVMGAYLDPEDDSQWDDSWAFGAGQACSGYPQQ